MSTFKLIPFKDKFMVSNVCQAILETTGLYIAHLGHLGLIPEDILMCAKNIKGKILLLNTSGGVDTAYMITEGFSPVFRVLNHSGRTAKKLPLAIDIADNNNYILGFNPETNVIDDSEIICRPDHGHDVYEYRCHINPDKIPFQTRYPAYVNLDRGSDSIGGSSWDGNLVSYLGSSFRTRIQFGVQSGLFPSEE